MNSEAYLKLEEIQHESDGTMMMPIGFEKMKGIIAESFSMSEQEINELIKKAEEQSQRIAWDGDTFYHYSQVSINEFIAYRQNYLYPSLVVRGKVLSVSEDYQEENKPSVYRDYEVETYSIEERKVVTIKKQVCVGVKYQN